MKLSKVVQKWSLAIKILPIIIIVIALKFLTHKYNLEIMELNALFTSLVAGTVFLIGFLVNGVLSDYKESEKIPSELTIYLKSLFDDTTTILKGKNSKTAKEFIEYQKMFTDLLIDWFYKKERTYLLLEKVSGMNDYFIGFDKEGIQANLIIRMKNDQNNIRRVILRIDTIRDTNFISSAYAIVEIMWFLITLGLLIIKIEPFYASIFFTTLVTFLLLYMLILIKDLDNPFDYVGQGEGGSEVSLKPIYDHDKCIKKLNRITKSKI